MPFRSSTRSLRVGEESVVEGMDEKARYDSDGVFSGGGGGAGELERAEGGATKGGGEYRSGNEVWGMEALERVAAGAAGGGWERCLRWCW